MCKKPRLFTKITPQVLPDNDGTDKLNTSAYSFVFSRLYLYCNCFVLYLRCRGWMALHTPNWVVALNVLSAVLIPIPQQSANSWALISECLLFVCIALTRTLDYNSCKKALSTNAGLILESVVITSHFRFNANIVLSDLPGWIIPLLFAIIASCSANVSECGSHTDELVKLMWVQFSTSNSLGYQVLM